MALIFESTWFRVTTPDSAPHVSRKDGGHVRIDSVLPVKDSTQLSRPLRFELTELERLVRRAMLAALKKRDIDIGNINVQENGNWSEPNVLHVHLYGRARSAVTQPYGQALHFPHPSQFDYSQLEPLNAGDIEEIRREIFAMLATGEFVNFVNNPQAG